MRRTVSISYGQNETKNEVLGLIDRLLTEKGMQRITLEECLKQFFSNEDLIDAANSAWHDQIVTDKLSSISLSADKAKTLTRVVEFTKVVYNGVQHPIDVTIHLSNQNDFPALATSIWTEHELKLPAGFIFFAGDDHVEQLLNDICDCFLESRNQLRR